MNYGYSPATVGASTPTLRSSDERDRLCIQLYLHAIDNFDLRDKDVLEVGSGRGGGASYISRYLEPRSMTGMDFSQEAVALCNRHRHAPGLTFVCGDAQSMPFPASTFDAVVIDIGEGDRHHNQCPDRAAAGQCTEAGTHRHLNPSRVSLAVSCVRRHRRNEELRRARARKVAVLKRTIGKRQSGRCLIGH
jgi:SAM-dependent methyltransferase